MGPNDLVDDCRLQLPANNIFRYYQQNGMPPVPSAARKELVIRTATEVQRARLARKRKGSD